MKKRSSFTKGSKFRKDGVQSSPQDPPRDPQLGFEGLSAAPDTKGLQMLEGTVARIVFSSPDSGWMVGVLEGPEGQADGIKIVGFLPGIQEGAQVKVWGNWKKNRKHGLQFSVERFVEVSPTTRRGILKYLGSGLVDGIGKGIASRIVDHFGEETLDIIESQPNRLTEIPGIGAKRSKQIKEAFGEKKALARNLVFLRGHGLHMGQAQRVFKKYGTSTIQEVTKNPYQMVVDIQGVGFLTADRIAKSVGIEKDAPQRIQAGLLYTLVEASENGHCFLPKNQLIEEAQSKLGVEEWKLQEGLEGLVKKGWAVKEDRNKKKEESPIFYPSHLFRAEAGTARHLARLVNHRSEPLPFSHPKDTLELEKKLGIQLSPTQRRALSIVMKEKVSVLTGGPGTGKTTLIRGLLFLFQKLKLKVALAAPTGRASRRMKELTGHDAKTIHRLLEYTPHLHSFSRNEDNPVDADVVIVDEVSMVDISLAHDLTKALDTQTRLILVGDVDQLPSVGPGSVLTDIIRSEAVPKVRLVDIFRQAQESQIVVAAHQVNQGLPIEQGLASKEGNLFVIPKEDPETIVDLICKMTAERIPRRFHMNPKKDVQILCPMKNGVLGTANLNERLRDLLNPQGAVSQTDTPKQGKALVFRAGDKVMQIQNNYDKEVFNGDIGYVLSVDPQSKKMMVNFDHRPVAYERNERSQLVLAYACTIHKSQGSEYPAVIVPIHTQHFIMLQRNLLYTAITRARDICVLIGEKRAIYRAIKNATIRLRHTRLHRRLARIAASHSGRKSK